MLCLPKQLAEKFKEKLRSGEINPEKLADMTSQERRDFFSSFLGEAQARSVNALFESKLLLKSQQQGIINWAKQVVGMKPEVLRDILSRVNRMTEVLQPRELESFLNDLANQRLGVEVTVEEATRIAELARLVAENKSKIREDSPIRSPERLEYGLALVAFKEYVGDLKLEAESTPFIELIKSPKDFIVEVGGALKSFLSTLDNSFFGRQGIKVLYTNPSVWGRNFIKSWGDILRELKGVSAMVPIKADVFSRPNALSGTYNRMGLDIGLSTEEAFPSSFPERIPYLRRLFKAAESAYNGAALRMRADLADRMIDKAEDQGVDTTEREQAESIGNLVNAMTGRGKTKLASVYGKEINTVLFSIKFLKSNFDILTAHQFQGGVTPFVRKQAAINLLKIVGTIAAIQFIANIFWPDSVDKKHIGKIKIGGVWIDLTGGMASIAQLAYNMVEKIRTQSGKYGEQTALDIFENFWEGKLAPLMGIIRDLAKGQNFDGNKPTITNIAGGLIPLPIQTFNDLRKADANLLLFLFDALGFTTTIPRKANWNQNPGVELKQFRDKVGQKKFDEANEFFNDRYETWLDEIKENPKYKALSEEDQKKVNTSKKDEIKNDIFRKYNFKYSAEKKEKLPKF